MHKKNNIKEQETRSGQRQILFFKDQDEFAKALREGAGAAEGIGFTEKAVTNK